jgi:hypothetical protein
LDVSYSSPSIISLLPGIGDGGCGVQKKQLNEGAMIMIRISEGEETTIKV